MVLFAVVLQPMVGAVGHEWCASQRRMFVNVVAQMARFVTVFVMAVATITMMTFQITFMLVQVMTMMTCMRMTQLPTELFPDFGQFVS